VTLLDCPNGRDVIVRGIAGSAAARRRLLEWGFVRGARVRAVSRGPAGGLIVALAECRVALDARTAGSLLVEAAT
jgi:Fe2+ transport system protein FeoA